MKLFYDTEIRRAIPDRGVDPEHLNPDIEYCKGWTDFTGMQLACLCACVLDESGVISLPLIYDAHNIKDFQAQINKAETVISFNGDAFDSCVLEPYGVLIPPHKSLDLLVEIRRATGKRFKLDDLCNANLGLCKSGSGASAPINWQRGRVADVISYCILDVDLTRRLYELAKERGYLLNPVDGSRIPLALKRETGLFG